MEGVFEDRGLSRESLVSELEACGFVQRGDTFSFDLCIPEDKRVRKTPYYLNVYFKDSKSTYFFKKTAKVLLYFEGRETLYNLGDLWQGVRQEWERLVHYDDWVLGKYEVEDLAPHSYHHHNWRIKHEQSN